MTSPRTQSTYATAPKRRLAGMVDPTKIIKPFEGLGIAGTGGVNPGEPVQADSQGRFVQLTDGPCIGVVNNIQYRGARGSSLSTRYAENESVQISRASVVAIPVTADVSAGEIVVPDGNRKWQPGAYGWPIRAGVQARMLYNAKAGEYMDALILMPNWSDSAALGELDLSVNPNPPIFKGGIISTGNVGAGRVVGLGAGNNFERSVTDGVGVALAGKSDYTTGSAYIAGPGAAVKMQLGAGAAIGSVLGFGASNKLIALTSTHKFYFLVVEAGAANDVVTAIFHMRP